MNISNDVTHHWRATVVTGVVVEWGSSQLCESEPQWLCCYQLSIEMLVVLHCESLGLFQGWTPDPSVLSGLEGNGLSGGGGLGVECDCHVSCAVACVPRC